MNEIIVNAGLAQYLCTDEGHRSTLADMPPDATFHDVSEALSDDRVTPLEKSLYLRQMSAFWHAQGEMAKSFKIQAEDWRKVVETLRQELDGQNLQE